MRPFTWWDVKVRRHCWSWAWRGVAWRGVAYRASLSVDPVGAEWRCVCLLAHDGRVSFRVARPVSLTPSSPHPSPPPLPPSPHASPPPPFSHPRFPPSSPSSPPPSPSPPPPPSLHTRRDARPRQAAPRAHHGHLFRDRARLRPHDRLRHLLHARRG